MPYSETYLMSRTPREISELAGLNRGPVNSGHKQFDKAVNGKYGHIGTGNVSSANQRSSFIRAHTRTFCNGRENPAGHLQAFDMKPFRLPGLIEGAVLSEARDKDLILYQIISPNGRNETTHGFLVTDTFYRQIMYYAALQPKASDVMKEAMGYLSWSDENATDPVPADDIREATRALDADAFHALARDLGYGSADDADSCRKSGLHFYDERPFSSWKDADPSGSMSRASTPGLASALLAIRAGMDLDAVKDWVRDHSREIEMEP